MFQFIFRKKQKSEFLPVPTGPQTKTADQGSPTPDFIQPNLESNLQELQHSFTNCSDVVFRTITVENSLAACLIYIDGLCDTELLDQLLLQPFLPGGELAQAAAEKNLGTLTRDKLAAAGKVQQAQTLTNLMDGIMIGQTGILIEGESQGLLADFSKSAQRGIEEPTSEKVVRGPRDGFTETLRVNTSLLRKRIHSSRLKMESMSMGELTRTEVVLCYIEGIVQDELLHLVRKRLQQIHIQALGGSANIEELIEDNPYSPFPQLQNTERPDVTAASLLEGKVAILVDNTPFVLIAPMNYWTGLQSAEDYHERFQYMTFVRWIRYTFVHISLLLPSLYVALTTFHPQVIPTSLLISVASAREGVPLPAVFEAIIMEFVFEGLREAGIRLPQQVGPAVSIAGALVIGQAAVEAGIISAPMVIIVATTGIASFAFPRYNLGFAFRMLRFPLLVCAGFMGFYGIVLFLIALSVHLVSLKPFGVPYMTPVAPSSSRHLNDVLFRGPVWKKKNKKQLLASIPPDMESDQTQESRSRSK
ncbi:spore germination protein [Paenibacillus illinoisensis]|uniref:spore germination protein n=1 Tax=Paenibacillus illinoisensis TaxID=59845 RepID=UPI003017FC1E